MTNWLMSDWLTYFRQSDWMCFRLRAWVILSRRCNHSDDLRFWHLLKMALNNLSLSDALVKIEWWAHRWRRVGCCCWWWWRWWWGGETEKMLLGPSGGISCRDKLMPGSRDLCRTALITGVSLSVSSYACMFPSPLLSVSLPLSCSFLTASPLLLFDSSLLCTITVSACLSFSLSVSFYLAV